MKDSNSSTHLSPGGRRDSRKSAVNSRGQRDARGNPEAQHDNQQKLGVGSDHRTADMKRGRRGTFP